MSIAADRQGSRNAMAEDLHEYDKSLAYSESRKSPFIYI
jgi:hypothetical protein